jgi:nucleoid-associated protein YgaU
MASSASKAKLTIEGSGPMDCLFNPKDYSVTKANGWDAKAKKGATAEQPQFTGGQPREMTLQLLFDTTLLAPPVSVKDITDKLFAAMDATVGGASGGAAKKQEKRPRTITFTFGTFSFIGVAKSLTVQYLLFKPDGEPLRADVKLALVQWDVPVEGQNPTTRSTGALSSHLVRDGDSLPSIAYKAYGDATMWRAIAEDNGIDNPLRLTSGRTLRVPEVD